MRKKTIVKGTIIEIIPTLIIAIIEIIKYRVFVDYIGSSMNGYYQFINQILGYIFLVEAGISSAVIYKMYKPMAKRNYKKVNQLYAGNLKIFRKISLVMFAIIIVASLLMTFLNFSSNDELVTVIFSFLLISIGNVFSFLFWSKAIAPIYYSLQEKYFIASISNFVKIILEIVIILSMIKFKSLLVVAILIFVFKFIEEVLILGITKRRYKFFKKEEKADTSASSMTKDLIFHQIGSVAANNIDSLVLMIVNGSVMVSIYGTYNYIFKFLTDLVMKFTNTITHFFGNLFVTKKDSDVYQNYKNYLYVCFMIATILSLCFFVGSRSFVRIWMSSDEYVLGINSIFMFSSILFLNILDIPMLNILSAKGMFKDSKYYALIYALVNFVLSIILSYYLSIFGVLLATVISLFLSIYLKVRLICKKVFKESNVMKVLGQYFLWYFVYVLICLILFNVDKIFMTNINGYVMWFLYMTIFGTVTLVAIVSVSCLVNKYVKEQIKSILIFIKRKVFVKNNG